MIKVSVKFEQWLEAEVKRRDRENKKMDKPNWHSIWIADLIGDNPK